MSKTEWKKRPKVREWLDDNRDGKIIITGNCNTSNPRLHIPTEDSNGSVCSQAFPEHGVKVKDMAVYPPGNRKICEKCIAAIENPDGGWNGRQICYDADRLEEYYNNANGNITTVADRLGVSVHTVLCWLDNHGIRKRRRRGDDQ